MGSRICLLVCGAIVCLPVVLLAEDKYDIKIKKSAKGDVERITEEQENDARTVVKLNGDAVKDEQESQKKTVKYQKEVLEADDKDHVIRQRRVYEKGSSTKDGVTTDFPFIGKKVLIERVKDDKKPYRFSYESGEELTDEEAQPLKQEFEDKAKHEDNDFEKAFLPGKPVALNETWQIDVKTIFEKDDKLVCDFDNAKGTGKLVKAYTKDGQQWAVMDVHMDLPIKSIKGDVEITLKKGTVLTVDGTADLCIDGTTGAGSLKIASKMTSQGTVKAGGKVLDIELDVKTKSSTVAEDLTKKK